MQARLVDFVSKRRLSVGFTLAALTCFSGFIYVFVSANKELNVLKSSSDCFDQEKNGRGQASEVCVQSMVCAPICRDYNQLNQDMMMSFFGALSCVALIFGAIICNKCVGECQPRLGEPQWREQPNSLTPLLSLPSQHTPSSDSFLPQP